MKYTDFEQIISAPRLNRYLAACNGNTRKAMTLYRLNLRLSQEMFTIISCFEVALRNRINNKCLTSLGADWLRDGADRGGIFDNRRCRLTASNINDTISKLSTNYTHNKLVAELGFGFWRYMFARNQYRATGRILLQIFPNRPSSTPHIQYNNTYVFNSLAQINHIRTRIAHHEPICFSLRLSPINFNYLNSKYNLINSLFYWMDVDSQALLYGLDHIDTIKSRIIAL